MGHRKKFGCISSYTHIVKKIKIIQLGLILLIHFDKTHLFNRSYFRSSFLSRYYGRFHKFQFCLRNWWLFVSNIWQCNNWSMHLNQIEKDASILVIHSYVLWVFPQWRFSLWKIRTKQISSRGPPSWEDRNKYVYEVCWYKKWKIGEN